MNKFLLSSVLAISLTSCAGYYYTDAPPPVVEPTVVTEPYIYTPGIGFVDDGWGWGGSWGWGGGGGHHHHHGHHHHGGHHGGHHH